MKNNLLPIIFRQFSKRRFYTAINILSLSIAIAITLLIYSFVVKEIKTDRFYQNENNIYRILTKDKPSDHYHAHNFGSLALAINQQVSGIESFTRLWELPMQIRTDPGQPIATIENCLYADTSFFKIFSFPQIQGRLDTNPIYQWAVISSKAAKKYFGNANPIGKYIYLQDDRWSKKQQTYQIVAMMEDIPAWSTIQTDIILDYRYMEKFTDWENNMQTIIFVQLSPKSSVNNIQKNIREIYNSAYPQFTGSVKLQPLRDIYYNEDQVNYFTSASIPQGSLFFTRLLTGIALLVLILSSCSYVLIQIVQSQHNLKLFALQRCFGATHLTVWKHFLLETSLYFLLSGILGIIFTSVLFPYFQSIITPHFHYPFPLDPGSILIFLSLLAIFILSITGILSLHFSKKLHSGIKESMQNHHQLLDLRKALAFISIVIFCLLLIDASIVNLQMDYLRNKDLGFNTENTITVCKSDSHLEATLQECPYIQSIALGSTPLPYNGPTYFKLSCIFEKNGTTDQTAEIITGDANYLETYQIQLLKGENFDPLSEPSNQGLVPILVNQKFIKQAGLEETAGIIFQGRLDNDSPMTTFKIIGIVKDFHFRSLYEPIPPIVICYSKGSNSQGFMNNSLTTIRYYPGKRGETLKYLKEHHISTFYEYNYEQLYGKDKSFILLVNMTTGIALLIGGFGIFAFSVFYAASRKKEVALRKINGGSEWEIQKLLHKEFVKITLTAYIITVPVAYYLIYHWLQKFTYRIHLEWFVIAGALIVCLLFVILIIAWQIRKIVRINPVEHLKDE